MVKMLMALFSTTTPMFTSSTGMTELHPQQPLSCPDGHLKVTMKPKPNLHSYYKHPSQDTKVSSTAYHYHPQWLTTVSCTTLITQNYMR